MSFAKCDITMPLQYAYTFILVATREGLTVREYAELADVSQSVMAQLA